MQSPATTDKQPAKPQTQFVSKYTKMLFEQQQQQPTPAVRSSIEAIKPYAPSSSYVSVMSHSKFNETEKPESERSVCEQSFYSQKDFAQVLSVTKESAPSRDFIQMSPTTSFEVEVPKITNVSLHSKIIDPVNDTKMSDNEAF